MHQAPRDDDSRRAGRFALLGGVLFGIALLFRVDLVLAVGLAGGITWLAATGAVRRRLLIGLPALEHHVCARAAEGGRSEGARDGGRLSKPGNERAALVHPSTAACRSTFQLNMM